MDDFERKRLGLLQQGLDPLTFRRLDRIGIKTGWRCLEVGAGAGSVARELAARVGVQGQVVATDLDTRFLDASDTPNLEVRHHNILEDALESAHYDLVHCRAVLMHLPNPVQAIERMATAVRPGGWLFLEEVDGLSFQSVDSDSPSGQEFDRAVQAILNGLRYARVMDMRFGRRLRGVIEQLGFVEVVNEGATGISRGGETGAEFLQMSLEFLRPMVAAGALAESDVTRLSELYTDPSFAFVDSTCFGAWGRHPD